MYLHICTAREKETNRFLSLNIRICTYIYTYMYIHNCIHVSMYKRHMCDMYKHIITHICMYIHTFTDICRCYVDTYDTSVGRY